MIIISRHEQQSCALAICIVVVEQFLIVWTCVAALPELCVCGKGRVGDYIESETFVNLYDSLTLGYSEYLSFWEHLATNIEYLLLYPHRHASATILRTNNQSRVGNVLFILPTLYVAESYETICIKCYNRFTFIHLHRKILRITHHDTVPFNLAGFVDGIKDVGYVTLMGGICYDYLYFQFYSS